ncbi:MAG: alpha-D-ribose 1-methylphosphonate 5-triphosphate synthase subunit PhnH [Oleiphilaceae bacterium]|jgi:alpha-D-ribose 1-methylphosphonate 5-triphosphate synthase subunit PhnH
MSALKLLPAFENTVDESQQVFRSVLKAMSEPGTIKTIHSRPLSEGQTGKDRVETDTIETSTVQIFPSLWAIAQALFDSDASVFIGKSLESRTLAQSLGFYTDARVTALRESADFALMTLTDWIENNDFSVGTWEQPQQSCTLIIQVPELGTAQQLLLSGPGILEKRWISIAGLTPGQQSLLQTNHDLYPCGLDFIFCSPEQILCIPRSTQIQLTSKEQ